MYFTQFNRNVLLRGVFNAVSTCYEIQNQKVEKMQPENQKHENTKTRTTRAPRVTMPFGEFEGVDLADVDPDYLIWVLDCAVDVRPSVRRMIQRTLFSDYEAEHQETRRLTMLGAWYLKMWTEYHADPEKMQVIRRAWHVLRQLFGDPTLADADEPAAIPHPATESPRVDHDAELSRLADEYAQKSQQYQ